MTQADRNAAAIAEFAGKDKLDVIAALLRERDAKAELLEALEELEDAASVTADARGRARWQLDAARGAARAAIAKATGR